MPSIRIECAGCGKTVRVPVDKSWDRKPVFSDPHPETKKRTLLEPGRHHSKYVTCRPCFQKASNRRRPSNG